MPRSRIWLASFIALTLLAAGCGKSLPSEAGGPGPTSTDAVDDHGAVGTATKNTTRLGGQDVIADAAAVARATHPGLTAASRAQTVVLVDRDDWPAALAASTLASSPLRAPLLYGEDGELPALSAQTLQALAPTGSSLLGGIQLITIGNIDAPAGYRTRAIPSANTTTLSAEVEQLASVIHGGPTRRVIVVAANGPRSLTMPAASLSAQTGAPIVFVERGGLPPATAELLRALKHPRMYVIGPTSTVSDATFKELERLGPVRRINGSSASSNAIAVAQYSDGRFGWGVQEPGHGLVFANSSRPFDAPAAAALSASGDYAPLLLLESANALSSELVGYLQDIQPGYTNEVQCRPVHGVYNHGWMIGDESAISAPVQAEIDSLLEISSRKACTAPPITP